MNRKLTDDQVREARRLYARGQSFRELAARYGMSDEGLRLAVRGRTYASVAGAVPARDSRRKGSRHPFAKLSEADVRVILGLAREGHSLGEIASRFGVKSVTIQSIFRGKSWRHVPRGDDDQAARARALLARDNNHRRGSRHALAKLTEADIPVIFALLRGGHSQRAVAARFGVNEAVVSRVVAGKRWKHVPRPASNDQTST